MTAQRGPIELIRHAFSSVDYPGDWCLRGSNEGDEPYAVERAFKGKWDWTALDPEFLDRAPDGLASALSFFSIEAFRFYLPAYLIADLEGKLASVDPSFQLTHGLSDSDRRQLVNPRRYGQRTWFDEQRHRFSVFDRLQCEAIVAYLLAKRDFIELDAGSGAADQDGIAEYLAQMHEPIDQALASYWYPRRDELAA